MVKEILYYTDNVLYRTPLGIIVKEQILKANLPIISVSLAPIDFGRNIVFEGRKSCSTMFKQILIGLKASKADFIFMCEHDDLYHPSHFDFIPPRDDIYYYNNNVWKYRLSDKRVITYDCKWLSQCCAARKILIEHYENKLARIAEGKRAYGYEPGIGQSKYLTPYKSEGWESEYPNVVIRHTRNWSFRKGMKEEEFEDKEKFKNWREIKVEDITGWDTELLLSLAE